MAATNPIIPKSDFVKFDEWCRCPDVGQLLPPEFYKQFVAHSRVDAAFKKVLGSIWDYRDSGESIWERGDDRLVVLVGGPGSGKSRAIGKLQSKLNSVWKVKMSASETLIPHIAITSPIEVKGERARTFYQKLSEALMPELIGVRLEDESVDGGGIRSFQLLSMKTQDLKRYFWSRAKERGLRAIFVDEAQHLIDNPKTAKKDLAMLKELIIALDVTLVFVGTFDLLQVLNLYPDMIRRETTAHLSRYRYDLPLGGGKEDKKKLSGEDWKEFLGIVGRLGTLTNIDGLRQVLLSHSLEVFRGSIGVIGILKAWIARAVREKAIDGRPFEWNHMVKSKMPDKKLLTILKYYERGEELYSGLEEADCKELDILLGIPVSGGVGKSVEPAGSTKEADKKDVDPTWKPGDRNLERRSVDHPAFPREELQTA